MDSHAHRYAMMTQPAPAAGVRVLLVDDEQALRRIAARILRQAGYQVFDACDGVAALAVLTAEPSGFDLVLADLSMPRMGGHELARHVQDLAPTTPMLFMTGYDEDPANEAGPPPQVPCMIKPFTPAQLVAGVGAALATSKRGG